MQVSSQVVKAKKSALADGQGWSVDSDGLVSSLLDEAAARAAWDAFHTKYPARSLRKGEKSPLQLLKAARDSR
jgi:hypothetical protein